METVKEVLKRFNLNIDLSEELLNLEVRGGYKTYETEYFDDGDVRYIFSSDRQFKDNDSYFTSMLIYSSGENSTVGDYIRPELDMPPIGYIYNNQGIAVRMVD
jgi:hypothetical protein